MTRDRYEQIKALAVVLLDDIEWCSVPDLPPADEAGIRAEFAGVLADPVFQEAVRRDVGVILGLLDGRLDGLPERQEVIQEAAGIVQLSITRAVDAVWPGAQLRAVGIVTKFRYPEDSVGNAI